MSLSRLMVDYLKSIETKAPGSSAAMSKRELPFAGRVFSQLQISGQLIGDQQQDKAIIDACKETKFLVNLIMFFNRPQVEQPDAVAAEAAKELSDYFRDHIESTEEWKIYWRDVSLLIPNQKDQDTLKNKIVGALGWAMLEAMFKKLQAEQKLPLILGNNAKRLNAIRGALLDPSGNEKTLDVLAQLKNPIREQLSKRFKMKKSEVKGVDVKVLKREGVTEDLAALEKGLAEMRANRNKFVASGGISHQELMQYVTDLMAQPNSDLKQFALKKVFDTINHARALVTISKNKFRQLLIYH